jgi:hypothetical protein
MEDEDLLRAPAALSAKSPFSNTISVGMLITTYCWQ